MDYLRRKCFFYEQDCIFVPFVKNSHWTLFVIEGFRDLFKEILEHFLKVDKLKEMERKANEENKKIVVENAVDSGQNNCMVNEQSSSNNLIEIISKKSCRSMSEKKKQKKRDILQTPRISDMYMNQQEKDDFFQESDENSSFSLSIRSVIVSETFECVVKSLDNSHLRPKIESKTSNNPDQKPQKTKIYEIPETRSKVCIFHLDSMSTCSSEEDYQKLSKVFKHLLNYLMIKELNQRMTSIEIEFLKETVLPKSKVKRSEKSEGNLLDFNSGKRAKQNNARIQRE